MAIYKLTLVPSTMSSTIREILTQTRKFEASDLKMAQQMAHKAFENDPTWDVESVIAT